MKRTRSAVVAMATLALTAAATLLPACAQSRPHLINPSVANWIGAASNLDQPTNISSTPALPTALFVTSKTGTITRFAIRTPTGAARSGTYLDISNRVESTGEAGLLSMVFSPKFAKDGFLFVTFSDRAHDLVLARFRALDTRGHVNPRATRISPATMRTLLVINHRAHDNHWGGSLAFGPDGLLYFGTGDGGGSGDSTDSARHLNILRGKVLRVDALHTCGSKYYCIPKANPYIKQHAPLVWLLGLRNPWKFNFDPTTHLLWIGDVGQDSYEEVDVVSIKTTIHDLGWPCWEARHAFDPSRCSVHPYLYPVFEIAHPIAESLTGGVIVPAGLPGLSGAYIAGDYVTGRIWWYDPASKSQTSTQLVDPNTGGPVAFGVDQLGNVWTVTFSGSLLELRSIATS